MLLKLKGYSYRYHQKTKPFHKIGYSLITTFLLLSSAPVFADEESTEINFTPDELSELIENKMSEYNQVSEKLNKIYAESDANNPKVVINNRNFANHLSNYATKHTHVYENNDTHSWGESMSFDNWYSNHYNRSRANAYRQYLEQRLGKNNVPPMSQLLLTARSWSSCRASQYEVPPSYLWGNMVPTLSVYANLKRNRILPRGTVIRSVYRNPRLNSCAKGAYGSKHKVNAAIDLWVPQINSQSWLKTSVHNNVCKFWFYQGQNYNLGLGIYRSGSIHLDTQGYRKWGSKYTARGSYCRTS